MDALDSAVLIHDRHGVFAHLAGAHGVEDRGAQFSSSPLQRRFVLNGKTRPVFLRRVFRQRLGRHDATREPHSIYRNLAVGLVTEALETTERARGHLYSFHQLTGNYRSNDAFLVRGYLDATGVQDVYFEAEQSVQAIVDYYGPTNLTTILKQSTPHGLSVREPGAGKSFTAENTPLNMWSSRVFSPG